MWTGASPSQDGRSPDGSGAPNQRRRNDMIDPGQTIENPVTGERLTFHETSRSTGGEYVLVEAVVEAGGFVAAAHVHPKQSETFKLISGRLGMQAGRKK